MHTEPMQTHTQETEGNRSRRMGPAALVKGNEDEIKHDLNGRPVPPSGQRRDLPSVGQPPAQLGQNSQQNKSRQEHFQQILNIDRSVMMQGEQTAGQGGGAQGNVQIDGGRHPGSGSGAPSGDY